MEWFSYWKNFCADFLRALGIKDDKFRLRDHEKEELSHYSTATTDIEFLFPFGWGELWGIADRTDFDLKSHMEHSKKDLSYRDPETNEKYIPYCIEPSLGADRVLLAFLVNAYDEEELPDEKSTDDARTVLRLHPALAPFKAAVLPLTKKQAGKAEEVYAALSKHFMIDYDASGNIGKRYRREDEIGTPFCITIDFDTETDDTVTIRDRDTMEQERVGISELKGYIESKLEF
jgi:glycyl-tRNA synthetase